LIQKLNKRRGTWKKKPQLVFVANDEERTDGMTPGVMIFIPIIMKISGLERI
jgi:hypothetical protein